MSLKPLFDRVVLKDAEIEETTKSGIILTSAAQESRSTPTSWPSARAALWMARKSPCR